MKTLFAVVIALAILTGCVSSGTQSAATLSAASLARPVDPIDFPRYLLFYNTFASARRGMTAMKVHELLPFKFSDSEASMVRANFPTPAKMSCQGEFCSIAWEGEETSISLSSEPKNPGLHFDTNIQMRFRLSEGDGGKALEACAMTGYQRRDGLNWQPFNGFLIVLSEDEKRVKAVYFDYGQSSVYPAPDCG